VGGSNSISGARKRSWPSGMTSSCREETQQTWKCLDLTGTRAYLCDATATTAGHRVSRHASAAWRLSHRGSTAGQYLPDYKVWAWQASTCSAAHRLQAMQQPTIGRAPGMFSDMPILHPSWMAAGGTLNKYSNSLLFTPVPLTHRIACPVDLPLWPSLISAYHCNTCKRTPHPCPQNMPHSPSLTTLPALLPYCSLVLALHSNTSHTSSVRIPHPCLITHAISDSALPLTYRVTCPRVDHGV
jgi:hypothetical protein